MVVFCNVCGRSYTKQRHLRLHFARNHVSKDDWIHKCEICGKVYADIEILERHSLTHIDLQVKCPIGNCNEVFASHLTMHKHRKSVHMLGKEEQKTKKVSLKKEYGCNECEMSFSKHHLLTQHSYIHTKILPFSCEKCDKRFLTLAHRNRHEKVHKGYPCSQCDVLCETWSKLRYHMNSEHARTYNCTECDKTFRMACRLKEHMMIHGKERKVYKCTICSRTFIKKFGLKNHVKIQHDGIKRFKCPKDDCEKVFAYKQSLSKHMLTHKPDYIRPTPKRRKSNKKIERKKMDLISRITGIKPKMIVVGVT